MSQSSQAKQLIARRIGVVMAGGSGERFWPMSQPKRPKQLLRLTDPSVTMLDEAILRLGPAVGAESIYVSTSQALIEPITECGSVPLDRILAEPAKRNTLGALCWVVACLSAQGQDSATVAVVTADHKIGSPENFVRCVTAAMDVAEDHGGIVTIGIPPDRPETGYGYIEIDDQDSVGARDERSAYRARSFREKPDLATAEKYVNSGTFLWNAGMFFFTVSSFLSELKLTQAKAFAIMAPLTELIRESRLPEATALFETLPSLSIDFAVMEKASIVYTIPADFPWDDVGSWDSLERSYPLDSERNVIAGDVISIGASDCIAVNELKGIPLGIVGLENVIVVATPDGILVCPKSMAQSVRSVADSLRQRSS